MAELVGERHEEIASDAGLEILFRRIWRTPLECLSQCMPIAVEQRCNGDLPDGNRQSFSQFCDIVITVLRCIGRRHEETPYILGAKRIDGKHGGQRRVHSAAQADHHTRKSIFPHVVAYP